MAAGAKCYFDSKMKQMDRDIGEFFARQENIPMQTHVVVPRYDVGTTNDVVENEGVLLINHAEMLETEDATAVSVDDSYWMGGGFFMHDVPIIFIHTDGHVQRGAATLTDDDIVALARNVASNEFDNSLVFFLAEPPANALRVMQVKTLLDENGARARDFDWGSDIFSNPFLKKLP